MTLLSAITFRHFKKYLHKKLKWDNHILKSDAVCLFSEQRWAVGAGRQFFSSVQYLFIRTDFTLQELTFLVGVSAKHPLYQNQSYRVNSLEISTGNHVVASLIFVEASTPHVEVMSRRQQTCSPRYHVETS